MKHGSLFSGIGGFDLAAEWSGWENMFHCEWNEFGQKILKHYWPEAISYGDITKTDFTIWRGKIDILTGGFPCQPYSTAGKRKGKEDDRHLWPEMLRAIREIQPGWIVGENVRGLTNWNEGLVFDEVQADLEAEGYEVLPFLLPACAVNAPHRRDRIWFIAFKNTGSNGCGNGEHEEQISFRDIRESGSGGEERDTGRANEENISNPNSHGQHRGHVENEVNSGEGRVNALSNIVTGRDNGDATDTGSIGQQRSRRSKGQRGEKTFGNGQASWAYYDDRWPIESAFCDGDDGLSSRLDGITVSDWRQESLKGGGNAIVPQVAFQIFQAIEQYMKK